jgi:hypothetical protein
LDEYKKLSKQFKKQKRSDALHRLAHKTRRVNPYPRLKYKYLTKKNIAPDISTITENIAFVIDGKVVEIIHCQPKMAAILLSSPEIVQVPEGKVIKPGFKYEDGKFNLPDEPKQPEQEDEDLPTFKDYLHRLNAGLPQLPKLPTFKDYIKTIKERV